jgi:hypothetical protein
MLAGVALSIGINLAQDRRRPAPSPARDIRDRSAAACEAHSAAGWAKVLGTAPDPKAVARALAASVDPAFRRAAYLGCLGELR